jgi:hypothetical protein
MILFGVKAKGKISSKSKHGTVQEYTSQVCKVACMQRLDVKYVNRAMKFTVQSHYSPLLIGYDTSWAPQQIQTSTGKQLSLL